MTPEQEQDMRRNLADYSSRELVDLAISLQEVCDTNTQEIRGLKSSADAMSQQLPALREQLEEYEAGPPVDNDLVAELQEKVGALQKRNDELTSLNEGLQRKLIG